MAIETVDQHIATTPGIAGGKPHVAGHRITVQHIAIWHERLGRSADEIAAEYNLARVAALAGHLARSAHGGPSRFCGTPLISSA
jgi:uncharacterized protein (DUF433 family)